MAGKTFYPLEVREAAVAGYYALLSRGRSKTRARFEAGAANQVNPSSLRNWIERGTKWSPAGCGDADAAELVSLRHDVAGLRHQVAELTEREQIIAASLSFFDVKMARPSPGQVADFLATQTTAHGQAKVLGVLDEVFERQPSRALGRLMRGPTAREIADATAANRILDLWVENYRCYGVDKMVQLLRRRGSRSGRGRVGRLMELVGIEGIVPKATGVRIGVLRKPTKWSWRPLDWPLPDQVNQWWAVDLTAVMTDAGQAWVGFVTDLASRRILSCAVDSDGSAVSVNTLLTMALAARADSTPLFQGSVPAVTIATDLPTKDCSTRPDLRLEHAQSTVMQTTATLYHSECIRQESPTDCAALSTATHQWVDWYNQDRLHSAVDSTSPNQVEVAIAAAAKAQVRAAESDRASNLCPKSSGRPGKTDSCGNRSQPT